MNKPPRIIITLNLDINVCQPGSTTKQDLISLYHVEALVIEEDLPPLFSSNYYYSMLW